MHPQPIASIESSDGIGRLVCEDSRGQYVLDDQGEPIYHPETEISAPLGRPLPISRGSVLTQIF
jgi:hypothetical protein